MNFDDVEYIIIDSRYLILKPSNIIIANDIDLEEHEDKWMKIDYHWFRTKDIIIIYNTDNSIIYRTKYFNGEIEIEGCVPCGMQFIGHETLTRMSYKCEIDILVSNIVSIEHTDTSIIINGENIELYADRINRAKMIENIYELFIREFAYELSN